MTDINWNNYALPQSNQQPLPATLASAATVAPTGILTFITGTAQIATVTPPTGLSNGVHMLIFIFTNGAPGTFLTSGNVLTAVVPTQNIPTFLLWDPIQQKYYGWANNLT